MSSAKKAEVWDAHPTAIGHRFAISVEILIRDRYLGVGRSEAELLDDLDCFGSALDAELVWIDATRLLTVRDKRTN